MTTDTAKLDQDYVAHVQALPVQEARDLAISMYAAYSHAVSQVAESGAELDAVEDRLTEVTAERDALAARLIAVRAQLERTAAVAAGADLA